MYRAARARDSRAMGNKQAQVYIRDKNFRTETLPCVFVNCIDLHSILRRRQYATLLETRQTPIVKDEETDTLEEGATRQMSVILARLDLFSLPFFFFFAKSWIYPFISS